LEQILTCSWKNIIQGKELNLIKLRVCAPGLSGMWQMTVHAPVVSQGGFALPVTLLLSCFVCASDSFLVGAPPLHRRPHGIAPIGTPIASAPHARAVAMPLSCGGGRRPGALAGLRMQSSDPQWYAFQGYNLGKWTGTARHIDPNSGEYAQPYVVRKYSLDVNEVKTKEGSDAGVEKLESEASETLPALECSKTIVSDDDFDATAGKCSYKRLVHSCILLYLVFAQVRDVVRHFV